MHRSGPVRAKGKCICNLDKYCQIVSLDIAEFTLLSFIIQGYHPTVWFCKLKRKSSLPVNNLIHISLESGTKYFVMYVFINYIHPS